MKVYLVGGAVRDSLLGLPVTVKDWVVVGATPEEKEANGFRPVGKDFPVFLHPDTRKNTPWPAPSENPAMATGALPSMPPATSPWKKT